MLMKVVNRKNKAQQVRPIHTKTDMLIAEFLDVGLLNTNMQSDFCHSVLEPTDKHNIIKFQQKTNLHFIRWGVVIPPLLCEFRQNELTSHVGVS